MPELPIFQRLRADMERIGDLQSMLRVSGRIIGYGQCDAPYYPLDGKVYLVSSSTQCEETDYFEFCDMLRRAERDGRFVMRRAGNFHLGSET